MTRAGSESTSAPSLCSLKSVRLHIALLMMFGMMCNLMLRTNLGSTVVCMVNATALRPANSSDSTQRESSGYDGALLWDSHLQGLMFSAPTAGSFLSLLPAGFLSDKYNPKYMALFGAGVAGLLTYLLPFLANNYAYGFLIVRVLIGMSCGCIIPAFASMAARWFVPNERSTLDAVYTSGLQISGIVLGLSTPALCASKELGGWSSVFYLCAVITMVWGILWLFYSSNHADEHRLISEKEKKFIDDNVATKRHQNPNSFPWRSAFTSMPFLAILFVRIVHMIQHQLQMYYTTSFIRDVLKSDLNENILYATLPYLSDLVTKIVFAILADYLKARMITGQSASVRLFQSTGNMGNALCFVLLIYIAGPEHVCTSVALLTMSGVFMSLNSAGANTSALSIAPQYSGTLHSLTMFLAFGSSSGSVYLMGIVLKNKWTAAWTMCFWFIVGMNLFAGVLFAIFGSAEVQPWARQKNETPDSVISTTFSDLSSNSSSHTTRT